jgi:glycyl-tRNA synthetase beta chain
MNTYLLEIGVEELPAKQITRAVESLKEHIKQELEKEKLIYDSLQVLSTPRRITVFINGIADNLADEETIVYGPSLAIAYNEGKPTSALEGFLNTNKSTIDKIFKTTRGKNEVVALKLKTSAVESKSVILRLAPIWITAAVFDKSMRWRDYSVQFIRPIRWIVSLYNSEHLPVAIEGLQSDVFTYGHRTLANHKFTIPSAESYLNVMDEAKVIIDPQIRKQSIAEQIAKLEKSLSVIALKDEKLLDEILNIVEYPTVFSGHIDREFLSLPVPAITTPMKGHQKYLPTFYPSGELSDIFFAVRNGDDYFLDTVVKGNENVLRARLKDAQFFFAEDRKKRLEDFIESLKTVIYQTQLGTIYEKVQRIDALSAFIASFVSFSENEKMLLNRTVYLCKADLNTAMVNEFDELQGVMGKIYAEKDGENSDVCTAIESHYYPRFSGDETPKDIFGKIISIADKMDSLVGSYGIGTPPPKGNKDPFGLRRLMISILSVILTDYEKFNPSLEAIISKSAEIAATKFSENKDKVVKQVSEDMIQRLRVMMLDKDYSHDIVEAGLSFALNSIASTIECIKALSSFNREKLEGMTTNLLRAIKLSAGAKESQSVNEKLFESESEKILYDKVCKVTTIINSYVEKNNFSDALLELESLGNTIAAFINSVMVMHENKDIRENRMQLLRLCKDVILKVADFEKIRFS